jgi:lipoyl(octanoyl) transferase
MAYRPCAELQARLLEEVAGGADDKLVFVEHDPVLTLGANFHLENLLYSPDEYRRRGMEVEQTDRGGDVTYHGPNQLVIYPIFNLANHGRDLHRWLRSLEETMILTAASFGVSARRFPPHTGVWTDGGKLAAIGIKVKRWISMHGIALNCDNDLSVFRTFIPCGIRDYGVTSLTCEAGRPVTVCDAKPVVAAAFRDVFSGPVD